MSNLERKWHGTPALRDTTALSQRETRAIAREIDRELARGAASAAKIHAAGHVTDVALTLVGALSAKEAWINESTPASDPVQKAQVQRRTSFIVDGFTQAAAAEIAKFGR